MNEEIYKIDLLEQGYELKRTVDNMQLYKRDDEVVIVQPSEDRFREGVLEVVLRLRVKEGKNEASES